MTEHHPETSFVRLDFPGLTRPLVLPRDDGLFAALTACLKHWKPDVTEVAPDDTAMVQPLAIVDQSQGGYRIHSAHLDRPLSGLSIASTVCALIADLSQEWAQATEGALGLHCGAFRFDGPLIALVGPWRAGKSTLIARLSAEPRVQVFCDDVLPLGQDGTGVALGIAPRLRLPLPELATAKFHHHVQTHLGPADHRYGYIVAPTIASHGTAAPLGALILLHRQECRIARFHQLDQGDALALLVRQAITDLNDGETAFAVAKHLTDGKPCLRLVYSDLEDAVSLLVRAFADTGRFGSDVDISLPLTLPTTQQARATPIATDQVFHRAPDVALRMHGRTGFLWRPGDNMLWHMNPVAAAVWAMLEIPGSALDLTVELARIFPTVPERVLMQDVATLLADLSRVGLIYIDRSTQKYCHGD